MNLLKQPNGSYLNQSEVAEINRNTANDLSNERQSLEHNLYSIDKDCLDRAWNGLMQSATLIQAMGDKIDELNRRITEAQTILVYGRIPSEGPLKA